MIALRPANALGPVKIPENLGGTLCLGDGSTVGRMTKRRIVCVLTACCFLAVSARAQQQQRPEDPEDEKQIGLWLDQGISTGLSSNKSLDIEFHERFDEGASNLCRSAVRGGLCWS
jgi:hypothetical protein